MAMPAALLEPAARPVYVRLKDTIRAGIAAGELPEPVYRGDAYTFISELVAPPE